MGSDLVPIGRVGKPHGLDGSFFVEGPSEREEAFAKGATVHVDGVPATIVGSSLPELDEDAYYVFQLVGLVVEEEGGRVLGRVRDVVDYPANDVLELDSGLFLPLVEACVRQVDLDGGRITVSTGFAEPE